MNCEICGKEKSLLEVREVCEECIKEAKKLKEMVLDLKTQLDFWKELAELRGNYGVIMSCFIKYKGLEKEFLEFREKNRGFKAEPHNLYTTDSEGKIVKDKVLL